MAMAPRICTLSAFPQLYFISLKLLRQFHFERLAVLFSSMMKFPFAFALTVLPALILVILLPVDDVHSTPNNYRDPKFLAVDTLTSLSTCLA